MKDEKKELIELALKAAHELHECSMDKEARELLEKIARALRIELAMM